MRYPFTCSDHSINVFVGGKLRTVLSGHTNFKKLWEHLKGADHDEATIIRLSDREQAVRDSTKNSKVEVKNGEVLYEGQPVHNSLTEKLLHLMDEGFDAGPWIKFLENLMDNPSYRSRKCLYDFLEHFNAPITPDGKFIAFKRVGHDYYDLHSHTMLNEVGTTVKMDRRQVDEDPNRTCSAGLHVCADEYLKGYATGQNARTLVVAVNPANVVAVPADYNFAKMRVCEYDVIEEIGNDQIQETLSQPVHETKQERDAKGRFLPK